MSSRINVPLSNLRAIVIMIVVAFHSMLPYLASQPAHPFPFDAAPYRWVAFPILDHERFFGFDLFCAWQDVSLMSLMFLLAGLFTPASLGRKGSLTYLSDRWRRIGLPFLFAVAILSPLAYFASYRLTAADPSIAAFWQHWRALPMWPAGPEWFLWQVFLFGAIAAALNALAPGIVKALRRIGESVADRPLAFFIGLTALSVVAYVPLAMIFSPWRWASWGPFAFELSRPLQYLLYFFAGFAIGAAGLDRGVLHPDGTLARYWPAWLASAIISMSAWGGLTSLTLSGWATSPLVERFASAFAFPIACATGALCLLSISLRLMRMRNGWLDNLSSNAYSIYILHYVFVLWLQYALLSVSLGAIGKATIVFAAALALSWIASAGLTSLAQRHLNLSGKRAIADQAR
ncbi:MAG: acyltransferase family protein [Bradyrhizobium sp.]